jgi:DNA-binding FadR family transcriptional regulator
MSTSTKATPKFQLREKSNLGSQAMEAIKGMIVSGELSPGQALPAERELALMLGISRPSLREVISALQSMNILEVRHGEGTFVSSLDPALLMEPLNFLLQVSDETLEDLFEVRHVLEVGAARWAAQRITQEELENLDVLVAKAGHVIDRPTEFLQLDFEIHAAIVLAVGNPMYTSLYASTAQLSLGSRRRTAKIAEIRHQAHIDHVAVVDALRSRDSDAAAAVMKNHLEHIERTLHEKEDR